MGSWVQKSKAVRGDTRATSTKRSVPGGPTGFTFPIAYKCAKLIDIRRLRRSGPPERSGEARCTHKDSTILRDLFVSSAVKADLAMNRPVSPPEVAADAVTWLSEFHTGSKTVLTECYIDHFASVERAVGRILKLSLIHI